MFSLRAPGKNLAVVVILGAGLIGCTSFGTHEHFQRALPAITDEYPNRGLSYPGPSIAVGSNIWVLYSGGIARASTSGEFTLYAGPNRFSPVGLAYGSKNKIWITLAAGYPQEGRFDKIASFDTRAARYSNAAYRVPTYKAGVAGIAIGSDNTIWFIENLVNKIARLDARARFSEFTLSGPNRSTSASTLLGLNSIARGPDGAMWFTEFKANRIGRIGPAGGVTEFPLSNNAQPQVIISGVDGGMWFTEFGSNMIARISGSGKISEFRVPTQKAGVYAITVGPDRNIWFTELLANKVGRLNASGSITEFNIPGSGPTAIVTGNDGNIWVTERYASSTGFGTWGALCKLSLQQ